LFTASRLDIHHIVWRSVGKFACCVLGQSNN